MLQFQCTLSRRRVAVKVVLLGGVEQQPHAFQPVVLLAGWAVLFVPVVPIDVLGPACCAHESGSTTVVHHIDSRRWAPGTQQDPDHIWPPGRACCHQCVGGSLLPNIPRARSDQCVHDVSAPQSCSSVQSLREELHEIRLLLVSQILAACDQ
eukprot:7279110-Prymnesium_polylepis.1